MKDERTPRLVLEWYDPPAKPDAWWWWGQVVGGMNRLVDVREQFERASRLRRSLAALTEFRAALELYWWHGYALRERAIDLLGVRTCNKETAAKLKKPSARCAAQALLAAKDPMLTAKVVDLLRLLDDLIEFRNIHTHKLYVGIRLDVGTDTFSPEDVVAEVEGAANERRMKSMVAAVVRRKARECAEHLQAVIDCVSDLAQASHDTQSNPRGFADSHSITIRTFP